MIEQTLYAVLRKGFGDYVLTVQQLAGPEVAERAVKTLSETLKKIDTFYDTDAATGFTLTRSLNGKSQTVPLNLVSQLSDTFRLFLEKVQKDERRTVIQNLTFSMKIQMQKTANQKTVRNDA